MAVSLTAFLSAFLLLLSSPAAHADSSAGVPDPNATFIYSANQWTKGGAMRYAPAAGKKITNMSWNFLVRGVPAGATVDAQLCNQYRCVPLPVGDGYTSAFNGDPADSTFYFYHRLNALRNPVNPVVIYDKVAHVYYP